MQDIEVFQSVYADLRFPLIGADLDKLREFLQKPVEEQTSSHFAVSLRGLNEHRKAVLIASLRGLFSKTEMSTDAIRDLAASESIRSAGLSDALLSWTRQRFAHGVAEIGKDLVWMEESPWPFAFSTLLQQYVDVVRLHQVLIEKRVKEMTAAFEASGWASENLTRPLSEFPRQLPTHLLYAMASLGAWLGGAINVQYFAYYATIRQIFHSSLNLTYAQRMGFGEHEANTLNASGMISVPLTLIAPLLHAQRTNFVFGSIQVDEFNPANPPALANGVPDDVDDSLASPGFVVDKYYRTPFRARRLRGQALYGAQNVLRDHYTDFYTNLPAHTLLRCKHYCVPLIDVGSPDELRSYIAKIPLRNEQGLFFRGQRRLYQLERHESVRGLLFGQSCSIEPSLVTTASREAGFDYDELHHALRSFLEDDVLQRSDKSGEKLFARWRQQASNALCRLDYAVVALAQHYGIPTHGLDVTTNPNVALWFATNLYSRDSEGVAAYKSLDATQWPDSQADWPVIAVCQMVTNSIEQSLHDCEELREFGFEAQRPNRQSARFFQGGHSDHQNRLAEALVCVLRLAPGVYEANMSFDDLFPRPEVDPAYAAMLKFASSRSGAKWGRFVNRFHYQETQVGPRA
ncbi:MAG: FRG domain-containing protein [Acidobacteriaceae bacterium]